MTGAFAAVLTALLSLVAIATVLHAVIVLVVIATRHPRATGLEGHLPPVTWYRPLKTGVRDLRPKLLAFLESIEAGDQVLMGADPDSEALRIAREVAAGSGREATVIECIPDAARNPKVSKLLQMAPFSRNDHWIIADSEAVLDREFVRKFREEWVSTGAAALTAGYRFAGMGNLPQRLDAMATVLTLWPGIELVRAFGRVEFTLGACTALRRTDLEAIGGWKSLGDELAEDYWLGARLCERGQEVRLSESILTLDSDDMTWSDYWRHQHRVAVTYRAARPLGTAGMVFTRGVTASFLLMLIHPIWASILFLLALVFRVALAESMATIRGLPLKGSVGLIILSDAVETFAWLRAWVARYVWWRGRWRGVRWRGKLR